MGEGDESNAKARDDKDGMRRGNERESGASGAGNARNSAAESGEKAAESGGGIRGGLE